MICSQTAARTTEVSEASGGDRIPNLFRRTWQRYWNWRARRMTVAILHSLDERTLRDIGISAGEIESVVYGRVQDRRCRYHAYWRLPA